MTVRIFVGNDEDVKELAQEYPQEASIIEEMLKAAEDDGEDDDSASPEEP